MTDINEQVHEYVSYNILARKPLMYGVPLLTLIGTAFAIVVTTGLGVLFLDSITSILATPIILSCGLFMIRIMCENDSRAMDNAAWIIKGVLLRLQVKSTIFSVSPQLDSPIRKKEKIYDFFKHYQH